MGRDQVEQPLLRKEEVVPPSVLLKGRQAAHATHHHFSPDKALVWFETKQPNEVKSVLRDIDKITCFIKCRGEGQGCRHTLRKVDVRPVADKGQVESMPRWLCVKDAPRCNTGLKVGKVGFEPTISCSQNTRSWPLPYIPIDFKDQNVARMPEMAAPCYQEPGLDL